MDKNLIRKDLPSLAWILSVLSTSEIFLPFLPLSPSSSNLLALIQHSLQPLTLPSQSPIYSKGQPSKHIYLIFSGSISLLTTKNNVPQPLLTYSQNQLFGQCQSLTFTKRMFTTKTKTPVILYQLKFSVVSTILKEYRQKVYPFKLLAFNESVFWKTFVRKRQEREGMVGYARERGFVRHQVVYEEGEEKGEVFVIVEGEVQLQRRVKRGGRGGYMSICSVEEGNVVGEIEAVLGGGRKERAVVVSEKCRVYAVPREFLLHTVQDEEMYERLVGYAEWKQRQRENLFQKHHLCVLRTEEEMGELVKKSIREKQLREQMRGERKEAKSGQTFLIEGIDEMVRNKYRSYESKLEEKAKKRGVSMSMNLAAGEEGGNTNGEYFDFGSGLRPRVLRYRGRKDGRVKTKVERGDFEEGGKKVDSKISDVRRIRQMYEEEYNCLMMEPKLPPLLRSYSQPVRESNGSKKRSLFK